jgi:hypothetical protein
VAANLGVGMRSLPCWYCGFEPRWRHGYLSLLLVMCCQEEVSASGWSLVQGSPTGCGVSECYREVSTKKRPWAKRDCHATNRKMNTHVPFLWTWFLTSVSLLEAVFFIIISITDNAGISRSPCYQPVMERQLTFREWGDLQINQTTLNLHMSVLVTSCLPQIFQISYTTSLAREPRF